MIAPTRRLDEFRTGDPIPKLSRRFSAVDLAIYGGATWDWHRLHYDAGFARELNLPRPVIDGQMYGALFAKQAIDWLGPQAFVCRLKLRMRAMAFAGDSLAADGEIVETRAEEGQALVVLAQRLQRGDQLVAEATTELRLPG